MAHFTMRTSCLLFFLLTSFLSWLKALPFGLIYFLLRAKAYRQSKAAKQKQQSDHHHFAKLRVAKLKPMLQSTEIATAFIGYKRINSATESTIFLQCLLQSDKQFFLNYS